MTRKQKSFCIKNAGGRCASERMARYFIEDLFIVFMRKTIAVFFDATFGIGKNLNNFKSASRVTPIIRREKTNTTANKTWM